MQNKDFKHIIALCMTSLLFSQVPCGATEQIKSAVQNKSSQKNKSSLTEVLGGCLLVGGLSALAINNMNNGNEETYDDFEIIDNINFGKYNDFEHDGQYKAEDEVETDVDDDDEGKNLNYGDNEDNENFIFPEGLEYDLPQSKTAVPHSSDKLSEKLIDETTSIPTVSDKDKNEMKSVLKSQYKRYESEGQDGAEKVRFESLELNGLKFGLGHTLFRGNRNVDKIFSRGISSEVGEAQNNQMYNGTIDNYVSSVCTFAGLVGRTLDKNNYKEIADHVAKGLISNGQNREVDIVVDDQGQIVMVFEDAITGNFVKFGDYGGFDGNIVGCYLFSKYDSYNTHFVYKFGDSIRHGFSSFIDPKAVDGKNLTLYRLKLKFVKDDNSSHYEFGGCDNGEKINFKEYETEEDYRIDIDNDNDNEL